MDLPHKITFVVSSILLFMGFLSCIFFVFVIISNKRVMKHLNVTQDELLRSAEERNSKKKKSLTVFIPPLIITAIIILVNVLEHYHVK